MGLKYDPGLDYLHLSSKQYLLSLPTSYKIDIKRVCIVQLGLLNLMMLDMLASVMKVVEFDIVAGEIE